MFLSLVLTLGPPLDSAPPAVDFSASCDLLQKPAYTLIGGVCMSGVRLLDNIKLNQSFPGSGPRCKGLITGKNDLAIVAQRNIYCNLEGFIATRQANGDSVVATLPHRYDLDPDLSVHDENVLVNAYIEDLASQYNVKVLHLGGKELKFFTRHGKHLSKRGKRLLARMIARVALERPIKTGKYTRPGDSNTRSQMLSRLSTNTSDKCSTFRMLKLRDKSGSAAAVPQGVNVGQAASMSPGVESLASAKEASEHTSPTTRQTDSQSTVLESSLFEKGLSKPTAISTNKKYAIMDSLVLLHQNAQ
ncbi:hypothetical protein J6590_070859 [Homalodisca vitripennis]|nr:hypothetical protein J6590_070859 [Homalodisca vitripennis]